MKKGHFRSPKNFFICRNIFKTSKLAPNLKIFCAEKQFQIWGQFGSLVDQGISFQITPPF
jgi:hypothetical protein